MSIDGLCELEGGDQRTVRMAGCLAAQRLRRILVRTRMDKLQLGERHAALRSGDSATLD
jgi:hypothetical protein